MDHYDEHIGDAPDVELNENMEDDPVVELNENVDDALDVGLNENIVVVPVVVHNANERNPLVLAPVIECIFKYLSLQDIKNCRFVSEEWNAVAQPILRNRSRIIFLKNEVGVVNHEILYNPLDFLERFEETLLQMPFTAFTISGYSIHYPWSVEELTAFFESQHENIQNLILETLFLTVGGRRADIFDITPWIANCALTRANTNYHTRLEILGTPRGRIIIENGPLALVKELSLSRCQVNLQEQVKFHPIKMTLSDVSFFLNGNKFPGHLCVNDVADLSKANYIHLEYSDYRIANTKLSLDLQGNLDVEYLRLNNISVTNWRQSNWTVNTLVMDDQPFLEETDMKIKELQLYFQKIDISVLPRSLEKLRIHNSYGIVCSPLSTPKIIMDNLHSLTLTGLVPTVLMAVVKYMEFPNLEVLQLTGGTKQPELKADWIPKTVKRLKFGDIIIHSGDGNIDLNLEKLILSGYSFADAKKISDIIGPKNDIVFDFREADQSHANIIPFLEYLRPNNQFSPQKQERIYIGPFDWAHFSFSESPLARFVPWPTKYYVFENKRGQIFKICETQFAEFEKSNTMYPDVEIIRIVSC